MMRARIGIDKTKSWADWAEEEEDAAKLTKTLADAKSEGAGPLLSLSMRLRGGGQGNEGEPMLSCVAAASQLRILALFGNPC